MCIFSVTDVNLRLFKRACALAISELPFASVSKRVSVRNHSYENEFHLKVPFQPNQLIFIGKVLH